MNTAVLIPAYKPQNVLLSTAAEILARSDVDLIIVDDGSGDQHRWLFDRLERPERTHVLRHAVNLGKGAALKTGMNYALTHFPDLAGVVTADADGQHQVNDICRIVRCFQDKPGRLILGVRRFDREVPFRNRVGNVLTTKLVRLLMGKQISDTQTGLRAIPRSLMMQLLRVPSNGYEFELDMLITAKHRHMQIEEEPIRTIYDHPGNVSHFNPIIDSMKIYFVLLRFGFTSLVTATVDNLVFFVIFRVSGSVAVAQTVARAVAIGFNYTAARNAVFLSREKHALILPRYLVLVIVNGLISYALIRVLMTALQMPAIGAKLLAESILFLANFAIQRDFVFTGQINRSTATDWTNYYTKVPPTAKLTRKYTTAVLMHALKKYAGTGIRSLAELGGANSFFLDEIRRAVRPQRLHIVDLNDFGLDLLRNRLDATEQVFLHHVDCRTATLPEPCDAVFSVGLIEHFDPPNTRAATAAHFRLLRPGGIAIISFPTPTWLYRIARSFCEVAGLWKFPDERPLTRDEVLSAVQDHGSVLFEKTLWPLILTQRMIVARKNGS
jgi:putative flippase GtrA